MASHSSQGGSAVRGREATAASAGSEGTWTGATGGVIGRASLARAVFAPQVVPAHLHHIADQAQRVAQRVNLAAGRVVPLDGHLLHPVVALERQVEHLDV